MSTKKKEQSIFAHTGSIIKTNDREMTIVEKIEEPLIAVVENVLSEEECKALINLSKDRLTRSKIGETRKVDEIRTSSGMFFQENENEIIAKVEKRIAAIMNIPIEHGEGLQVLNYTPGQQYRPHYDFFSTKSKASENNRISTLIIYLNDVEEGGETLFPKMNFSVTPKKGTAVYFEYFYQDQALNERTLHSGEPVIKGEKWVATQWMRRKKIREQKTL